MSEPARDPVRDPDSTEPKRDHASGASGQGHPLPESPDTDVPPSADEAPTATAPPPQPDGVDGADAGDARAATAPLDGAMLAPGDVAEQPAVAATTAHDVAKPSRRPALFGAMRRVLTFLLVLALFVGGVALGTRAFQMARPTSPVAAALDPVAEPPAVAQEFIRALAANDMDGVRSSLDAQQHSDITQELEKFGIHRVDRVEVLGTEVDGPRSATAVMMLAENSDGLPFGVNLVILVDGGKIEGFR